MDREHLRRQLVRMTLNRNQRVANLQAAIDKINRDYDQRAIELQREIDRLTPPSEPQPTVKPKGPTPKQRKQAELEKVMRQVREFNERNQ